MSGYVYFIGCMCGDSLRVKIGFTRHHPNLRRDTFQPGSPEELDVLCYLPGDLGLERRFHETFASCRLHNEWFQPFGLMERFVYRLMRDGNGARRATPWENVRRAFFEEAYEWAPNPDADEDFMLLIESADTDPWNDEFEEEYAERLRLFRQREPAK